MKSFLVVFAIIAWVAAEAPRYGAPDRQSAPPAAAPYSPSGWRPQGAAFTLPKSQPQQVYGPPSPKPSYGPPREEPTTTDAYAFESITESPQFGKSSKSQYKEIKSDKQQTAGAYYVVLPQEKFVVAEPQRQNLVYLVSDLQRSAAIVNAPTAAILTPTANLQALPFAPFNGAVPVKASYVVYS